MALIILLWLIPLFLNQSASIYQTTPYSHNVLSFLHFFEKIIHLEPIFLIKFLIFNLFNKVSLYQDTFYILNQSYLDKIINLQQLIFFLFIIVNGRTCVPIINILSGQHVLTWVFLINEFNNERFLSA